VNADSAPTPLRQLSKTHQAARRVHLLREVDERRHLRANVSRVAVAAATLVAIAALAAVVASQRGSDVASAAEIRAKLAQAADSGVSIRGEYAVQSRNPGPRPPRIHGCVNCAPGVPSPTRFVIGVDGSFMSVALPVTGNNRERTASYDTAYDAKTGVETLGPFGDAAAGRPLYLRTFDLDPADIAFAPEALLAARVNRAVMSHDPHIRNTNLNGREAWELSTTFTPGESSYDAYGARLDVVVDRETGVVLRVTQYAYDPDRWTSIETLEHFEIGTPTTPSDFVLPKPADAIERAHDYGFRRVKPSEAAAAVGYRPLLPTNTFGQQLVDFAVAKVSTYPFPGIPERNDVVSARYGRGANAITVSMYRGPVRDLPEIGGGRTIHLAKGALAGDLTNLTTDPFGAARFTAFHAPSAKRWDLNARGLLIAINASTPAQARAVASSLRAQ
jgi:hypothetical protein